MKRLLLVEDNELNLDMLRRRLQRLGYEILVATDGAEGVRMARTEMPDIILMDMSLPVMDGWEATRQLKCEHPVRNVPIIGLSAHALSEDRDRALQAGCDEYETKPIHLKRLIAKIEKLTVKGDPNDTGERPTISS